MQAKPNGAGTGKRRQREILIRREAVEPAGPAEPVVTPELATILEHVNAVIGDALEALDRDGATYARDTR